MLWHRWSEDTPCISRIWMMEQEDFILRFSKLIQRESEVLDVASGGGRHALLFARLGCSVLAMERNPRCVRESRDAACREGLSLKIVEADVENMCLLPESFDVIVNTLFLYRPLFPQYISALRTSGLLFFRTFTTDNADVFGHPRPSRKYLLDPGELQRTFRELELIHYAESVIEDRAVATFVGRR